MQHWARVESWNSSGETISETVSCLFYARAHHLVSMVLEAGSIQCSRYGGSTQQLSPLFGVFIRMTLFCSDDSV